MKKKAFVSVLVVLALGAALAYGQNFSKLKALLSGQEEVPVVSTTGNGAFNATISKDETEINYELSYSDMESNVTQSHIHVGQKDVNGAIVIWFCSNLASPPTPPGVQPCPLRSGTITGTIRAADVIPQTNTQGLAAGELDEVIQAIRDGNAYVNVHTTGSPGGEIRTQIGPDNGKSHH